MIILDLDNCISDDGWRWHMILPHDPAAHPFARFARYHAHAIWDEAANHIVWRCRQDIIICTARPEEQRRNTERWLNRIGLRPFTVLMRADDDFRSSVNVKRDMAQAIVANGRAVERAFDDREDIIKMYHEMGIQATQLAINQGATEWQ